MATTTIDFSTGLSKGQVKARGDNKSVWVKVLTELAEGVANGPGEYDTFYKIGEFGNASGARTTARNIEARSDELPSEYVFDLSSTVINTGETKENSKGESVPVKTSELFAAVLSPETVAAMEAEDGDTDTEAGDDDEPEDEPDHESKPRRGRKSAA